MIGTQQPIGLTAGTQSQMRQAGIPVPTATSQYQSPGNYSSGLTTANAAWQAPQTGAQQMQGAVDAGNQLPEQLRIIGNPNATPDAATRQKYEQYYQSQYGAPAEARMRAAAYASGRSDSAFAGGQIGQLQSQNQYNAFMAGEQLADNYLNRLVQARGSFAGLEGNMSQAYNQLNQQRGQGLANFAMQDSANRNQFNMQGAQMKNQFSQNAYQNQLSAYDRLQDYNRYNTQKNLSLGAGLAGMAGGALGGVNPFTPMNPYTGTPLGGTQDSFGNWRTSANAPFGKPISAGGGIFD